MAQVDSCNCISKLSRTFLKVSFNIRFAFEVLTTQTTAKLFVVRVHRLMTCQFTCCIETLWTFIANIRLHTFMTNNVLLKVTFPGEFILTNITCEPSTFIVWLQQMSLELVKLSKTVWTMYTWVQLCISVNTIMTLQFSVYLKQLPTVRTVIWSSVAVYTTFMSLQVAGVAETFVTQRTLVWFVS